MTAAQESAHESAQEAAQEARETSRDTAGEVSRVRPDRRTLVRGLAVGGPTLPLLAACGGGSGSGGSAGSGDSSPSTTSSPSSSKAASGGSGGQSSGGAGGTTVAAADVPVGGGTVLADAKVVVTQPTKGEFKAFSAVCTHQGCLVKKVANGTIQCPCHGSAFAITDGAPKSGPAQKPLAGKTVAVSGGQISVT